MQAIQIIRSNWQSGNIELGELIRITQTFYCSDSRDKVYDILAGDARDLGIQPDCCKSESDVFCTVGKQLLRSQGTLDVLSYAQDG